MRTPIHTKWHKIADPMKVNLGLEVGDYHGLDKPDDARRYIDYDLVRSTFEMYALLPKYVMYDDIVSLVYKDDSPIHSSVRAMLKADLAHLPFSEMLIEFSTTKEIESHGCATHSDGRLPAREFVWIGEKKSGFFKNTSEFPFWAQSMTLVEPPSMKHPLVILNPNAIVGRYLTEDKLGTTKLGLEYRCFLSPFVKREPMPSHIREGLMEANFKNAMWSASCALTATIALLRTRGIVQEKIEAPVKLNKSRVQSGKPPVPDHTVIRIGHVYDRQGNKVAYNPTGRKMPVHWRAGHIRNQRFGSGLSKSYELFIEPMLINYVEGEDAPVPVKEVTI